MDEFPSLIERMKEIMVSHIPNMLGAVGILIAGWVLAFLISRGVEIALRRFALDKKLASYTDEDETVQHEIKMEIWISKGVFYLVLLLSLLVFFQLLGFTIVADPFNKFATALMTYSVKILGAAILLAIAWIIASVLRSVLRGVLNSLNVDRHIAKEAELSDEKLVPISKAVSEAAYWLVFLVFIFFILYALDMNALLIPIQSMFTKVLEYLPNLFTAGVIIFAGWICARILQRIVANFLAASDFDRLAINLGISNIIGKRRLSGLVGLLVYILVWIPVLIIALDTLKAAAITEPLKNILGNFLGAIQYIIAAAVILLVTYIAGSVVGRLVTALLTSLGFNNILSKLGISKDLPEGSITASEAVGKLTLAAIMLLASMEACKFLGFNALQELISRFIVFGGNVILGLLIFAVGIYIANLAYHIISDKSRQAVIVAILARISILVFAGAMALGQMGIAPEIINLAFAIIFGAVAVAAAIAFGVGGRDFAARKIEEWSKSFEKKD